MFCKILRSTVLALSIGCVLTGFYLVNTDEYVRTNCRVTSINIANKTFANAVYYTFQVRVASVMSTNTSVVSEIEKWVDIKPTMHQDAFSETIQDLVKQFRIKSTINCWLSKTTGDISFSPVITFVNNLSDELRQQLNNMFK